MGRGVFTSIRFPAAGAAIATVALAAVGPITEASAQTTQIFSAPNTQVTDTMIRNGQYATFNNDGPILLTRWSSVPDWERRTIFNFETGSIPTNATIVSAVLTLTVKTGLGAAGTTRPVTAYRLTQSFHEKQATWINRQTATAWGTPGGDLGEEYSTLQVTNTVGAKVSWDVRLLVQRAVSGQFGSPQTRIALVDVGGGGDVKESYREYHSSEASTLGNRPTLTVQYTVSSPTVPGVIDVPAGGDLQQALNLVAPGGTVRLAAGATFVGNFFLPSKGSTSYVTITTNTTLPPAGTRIDPSYRGSLATIRSADTLPALQTVTGASYYRIVGVAFESNVSGAGDVIALGNSTQATLAEVPHHIEIDRVLITGDVSVGQKRGISANAAHVVVKNSDFRDIKAAGQDSQAVAAWNTPGPLTISNNYIEAAGENIMIGGAHISLPSGTVPSDITIEDNFMTKDVQWRGTSWTVKNLFELKSGRRVVVRGNLMEYNWAGAQPGFAIVFTPRNSSGRNPWVVVEDVDFVENVVRHSGGAFNLLGHDDTATSGQLARILIKNNLVYDISGTNWGGSGLFAQIGGEPRDITIDHNTVQHTGNIITFYSGSYINASGTRVTGGPILGFVFTNNLMRHNSYGIFGSGQAYGNATLTYYAPGAVVRRNVMATDTSKASRYPPDNFFPTIAQFNACFVNPAVRDYRLVPSCPYNGAGLDGLDIGVAVESVLLAGIK